MERSLRSPRIASSSTSRTLSFESAPAPDMTPRYIGGIYRNDIWGPRERQPHPPIRPADSTVPAGQEGGGSYPPGCGNGSPGRPSPAARTSGGASNPTVVPSAHRRGRTAATIVAARAPTTPSSGQNSIGLADRSSPPSAGPVMAPVPHATPNSP